MSLYSSIEPVVKKDFYPLSSAQKRLYIIDKLEGSGTGYNIPAVFYIEGDLNIDRFKAAFQRQYVVFHDGL